MNENSQLTKSDRIEGRINKAVSAETGLTLTGAMAFANVEQIMEFAKVMAIAGVAIPKHLRECPGACMAVAIQASEWQMSPFAVANKTYVVNDRLAYEAQLVNAVILRRAPVIGRFRISYGGEGQKRKCRVAVTLDDGSGCEVDYESPEIGSIPVKNSPLWKGDPDQQLFYYSSRAMCRRHFPDVLLGIYTVDELQDEPPIRQASGKVVPSAKVPLFSLQDTNPAPAVSDEPETTQDSGAADETTAASDDSARDRHREKERNARVEQGEFERRDQEASDEPSQASAFWSRCDVAGWNHFRVMAVLRDNGITKAEHPGNLAPEEERAAMEPKVWRGLTTVMGKEAK